MATINKWTETIVSADTVRHSDYIFWGKWRPVESVITTDDITVITLADTGSVVRFYGNANVRVRYMATEPLVVTGLHGSPAGW